MLSTQACGTGCASVGTSTVNAWRTAGRRRRGEIRRAGDVAQVSGRGLRGAERPLVEEEELELLAPAERPVEAVGAYAHRRVVRERLVAGVVDRAAVLLAAEVVDELVVVPVAVRPGRRAQRPQRREREVLPVLRPLLAHGAGDLRAADLAVGVDRVAEVDVEVVALGGHARVDAEAVVRRLAVLPRRGVGVARDREAHVRRRRAARAPCGSCRAGSNARPCWNV